MKKSIHQIKIAVLGGGQLGRMLNQAASRLGIHLYYIDPTPNCPVSYISNRTEIGDFKDYDTVLAFGEDKDIITVEIENVSVEALESLEKEGKIVVPSSKILRLFKDKSIQKNFYKDARFPTADFSIHVNEKSIKQSITDGEIKLPFVQKASTGGYDGKGVQVIKSESDIDKIWDTHSVIESLVPIQKELAVIVARNQNGEMKTYDPVEMVFDPIANLLDYQLCPAEISEEIKQKCETIAQAIAQQLQLIGLLAIEFFYTKSGEIIINEIAPRTHNSGHHTIDVCPCSQFEQHLRAISNLPLGNTKINAPSLMLNVLGEDGYTGPVYYEGFSNILNMSGVYPHIYGKTDTKPYRKMGHINIVGDDVGKLKEKANFIKSTLKVISNNN